MILQHGFPGFFFILFFLFFVFLFFFHLIESCPTYREANLPASPKMATQIQHPNLPLPDYFSKFASIYVRQTGQFTLNILADIIAQDVQTSPNPFGPDSVVHDTAAGPGIGAAAIVARIPKEQLPKHVLVSDNVPMMISAARESLTASPLPHVECKELESQDLSSIPDNFFTHSINNFSIFTFVRPADAIRETYRTLRPGGLAVVTCWRRFAPVFIVHAAQKKIRPDLPLMPTPSRVLRRRLYTESGWREWIHRNQINRQNIDRRGP